MSLIPYVGRRMKTAVLALLFLGVGTPALAASGGGSGAVITIDQGAFAGEKVEAGRPLLVHRHGHGTEPTWGTLFGTEDFGGKSPRLVVKGPDGHSMKVRPEDVTPEVGETLETGKGPEAKKLSRGQPVTLPKFDGTWTIEALFAPDFALLRGAKDALKLVRAGDLTVIGPPPAPQLPPLRAEAFYQYVSSEFALQPAGANGGSNALTFRPAASYYVGVGAGYDGIGASYAFSIPAGRDVRAVEGTSDFRDLRLNYYSRRFAVELGYNKYTGYLLDNSNVLSAATLNGQKYFRLPNLTAEGYGVNLFYVFAPQVYSLPAGNDHSEIETESAGSLLAVASFRRQSVRNDGAIIPAEKQSAFGEDGTITGFRTFSSAAGPGYGYHWLPHYKFLGDSFFVAPLIALSLGYELISEDLATYRHESDVFGVNAHVRLGFGWNMPRFFAIISALADGFAGKSSNVQFNHTQTASTFTVGARF